MSEARKKRFLYLLISLLAALSLVLASCASPSPTSPSPTGAPPTATQPPTSTSSPEATETLESTFTPEPTNWLQRKLKANLISQVYLSADGTKLFAIGGAKGETGGFLPKDDGLFDIRVVDIDFATMASDGKIIFVIDGEYIGYLDQEGINKGGASVDFNNPEYGGIEAIASDGISLFVVYKNNIWRGTLHEYTGWSKIASNAKNLVVSPDGKYLAYESGEDIAVWKLTSSAPKLLGLGTLPVWTNVSLHFVSTDPVNPGIRVYSLDQNKVMDNPICTHHRKITSLAYFGGFTYFSDDINNVYVCDYIIGSKQMDVPNGQMIGIFRPSNLEEFLILNSNSDDGLIAFDLVNLK